MCPETALVQALDEYNSLYLLQTELKAKKIRIPHKSEGVLHTNHEPRYQTSHNKLDLILTEGFRYRIVVLSFAENRHLQSCS